MIKTIRFAPGAVAVGGSIDTPSGSPPIDRILYAGIFEGRSVNEGGTAVYDIGPVAVTATKVDENTITLDVATTAYSELHLTYLTHGVLNHTEVI